MDRGCHPTYFAQPDAFQRLNALAASGCRGMFSFTLPSFFVGPISPFLTLPRRRDAFVTWKTGIFASRARSAQVSPAISPSRSPLVHAKR